MKSASSPHRVFSCVEPLESRIAPARLIVTGVPNNPQDPTSEDIDYNEAPFIDTETGTDSISLAVGKGAEGVHDTYYLRLSAGDTLQVFNTTNGPQDYLTVHSGSVIAFFVDYDLDKEVDEGELVSLSLGKNASLTLRSGLAGSVVANYDEANNTIDMDGLSAKQGIKSLSITKGDVSGKILSGGDIGKVSMNGGVTSILAGSATNGETFEIFPGFESSRGTISFTPDAKQKGASISNVFIDSVGSEFVAGRIEAGAGGAGAAGGSLKNIRITEDFDGFTLKAGDGGAASGKVKGGAGGSISSIVIPGVGDPTANDLIALRAGAGGDSELGVGGAGGAVSKVVIGYQLVGNKLFPSGDLSADNISIQSGVGGDGKIGGKGGLISNLDILVATPDLAGADEISIIAGAGGAGNDVAGAKAGVGGSLTNIRANDVALSLGPNVLLQAGDGGVANGVAKGGAGGSITNASLLTTGMVVLAGNGSAGTIGGSGGGLTNIVVQQGEGVIAHDATFNAGRGGDGTAGNGGKGGAITRLQIRDGDFATLNVNSGTAANGGNSVGGRGGVGGSVNRFEVFEDDYGGGVLGFAGTMALRSGDGGDGTKGGGNGGSLVTIDFTSEDLAADVHAGNGGDVIGSGAVGKGGAGGVISGLRLLAEGVLEPDVYVSAVVRSGIGGNGAGANGSGGAGGDAKNLFVRVEGSASLVAGNGGNGADTGGVGGAAGKGGSIIQSGVFATTGSGELIAGDGGATGVRPGNGGNITGASGGKLTGLYAATTLTILSGDGTNGGAGGTIRNIGYGSTADDLTPTPSGNILIQAGDGSGEGRFAGVGGSVINVTGSVGSGAGTFTQILAGDGGGSADKSAAGGSIADIRIQRGGSLTADGDYVELRILAGDAGDGGQNVRIGAKGGDVRNVRIFEVSQPDISFTPADESADTIIRSIAAGNGGDAAVKGGVGGSLNEIRVLDHDIGVRLGAEFGYDKMGGLFAGEGGKALSASGDKGLSGSVTNVSAKAIAAIVAGREVPVMVEKVESIYLYSTRATAIATTDLLELEPQAGRPSDLNLTEADPDGMDGWFGFNPSAYLADNLVGAVFEPFRIDGNKFAFNDANGNGTFDVGETPIDGLIMARVFNQAKVNFTPEARLINGEFYDYDNRNA